PQDAIRNWAIVRRAIDARRHDRLQFTYNVELTLAGPHKHEQQVVRRLRRDDVSILVPRHAAPLEPGSESLPGRPIVVGFGPAGMFAGLLLARQGYRPLIIDRGADVSTRHRDIMVDFYRKRQFHPESN